MQHCPLPLVIAIVGHRDLIEEDKKRLHTQVEEIFDHLAKYYPNSRPFHLLCGLAEGADRLVAQVALNKGAKLIACLPMERSLYENDFETEESLGEFVDLLGHSAEGPHVMPLVDGNTPENVSEKKNRDKQYDALGKYLVAHCHVLIALWDGVDSGLSGGTSSVVERQRYGSDRKQTIDLKHPLRVPETGPVYHVLTPRLKNPTPIGDLEDWQLLHHSGFKTTDAARKHYRRVFGRLDAFNKDAARVDKKTKQQSADEFLPEIARATLDKHIQLLTDRYAIADALALRFQYETRRDLLILVFLFGVGGVVLLELFAHGPGNFHGAFLFSYVAMIGGAVLVYFGAQFREVKTRHLDYRALAEGLRVQICWMISGLDALVYDHYLDKQRTELDWIRKAIQSWTQFADDAGPTTDWQSLVGTHWIRKQYHFFVTAATRNHRKHTFEMVFYTTVIAILFLIGSTIVVMQLGNWPSLGKSLYTEWHSGFDKHGLLAIAFTILPTMAAAVTAYSLKMAFAEQWKQYERMRDSFGRGLEAFRQATSNGSTIAAQSVMFELGKEALSENGDWVLLHRERTLEVFVGG